MNPPLATTERQAEWKYVHDERLGTLCGTAVPTKEQEAIAVREANEWLERLDETP